MESQIAGNNQEFGPLIVTLDSRSTNSYDDFCLLQVAGTAKWIQANIGERVIEPMYKVTGLEEDYEYEFRISAENKAGVGEFSEVTSPTKAVDRTVGNKPEMLLPLSDVTATVGKPLRIECDVTEGHPPATLKW